MSVVTALAMAFIFGIGIGKSHAITLDKITFEGKQIMDLLLSSIIIPLLPIYIACIFASMAAQGTVFETIKTFVFVLGLALCVHWLWLLVLYAIAGLVAHRNPFVLIKNMLPAYLTAAGTMSSTATIPMTLRSVKNNQVSNPVADFGVPLCATIHISGSVITITTCSLAVMMLSPQLTLPAFPQMLQFVLMLGLIMIAAPGIPGGGVMASLGILASMLGFDEAALGLMIALYIAQDSLGTAANVTGDGAILVMIDKWMKRA
jgi:Na+/H+-dicarboxylate symporter